MTFWEWFFTIGIVLNTLYCLILIRDGVRETIRLHRMTREQ